MILRITAKETVGGKKNDTLVSGLNMLVIHELTHVTRVISLATDYYPTIVELDIPDILRQLRLEPYGVEEVTFKRGPKVPKHW